MTVSLAARRLPAPQPGVISFRLVGLVLVVDQLLLPMLHLGSAPFKISYFLLAGWLVQWLNSPASAIDEGSARDFRYFSLFIGGIVLCALCGELILGSFHPVWSYSETVRSLLIYALVVLAFGTGLSAIRFNVGWLIPLLFVAVTLNLVFIFLRSYLPTFVVDLYYPAEYIQGLKLDFVSNAADVLDLARPRGLFGNPNQSALMVDVIPLFIHLALRNGLLKTPSAPVGFGIMFAPLIVSLCVASRGEFIAGTVLAVLNFSYMMRRWPRATRVKSTVTLIAIPVVAAIGLGLSGVSDKLFDNFSRILEIVQILDKSSPDEKSESVSRPLLFLDIAAGRAALSPIIGTGFSSSDTPPFDYVTEYFHNDWLRLLVTSGIVGVGLMLLIIARFCLPLGWPSVIPFIFPGMLNTFQLSIPAFIFYFFMIGALRAKLRAKHAA